MIMAALTITSIGANEILKWTGTAWINNTLAEAGISPTSHTHLEADITDLQNYLVNVVEDTTPELGGQLDALGNNIINIGYLESNGAKRGEPGTSF